MRTEADKMPESTISTIGNAPASLMTDWGLPGSAIKTRADCPLRP